MIFKVAQDYGIDLTDDDLTLRIATALKAVTVPQLEIDLCGCILDYPATSTVIDGALQSLAQARSPRSLIVIFDIAFHERIFFKWLFFGGKLVDEEKSRLDENDLREHLNCCFRERGVRFTIRIRDPFKETLLDIYSYGQSRES